MMTITCKIPTRLNAELDAVAREERTTKSTVVREAIEQRLRARRRKRSPSAYELAKHVVGSLRGPKDLLTNPKHMEDFGA